MVLHFLRRLSLLPEGSLHLDIFRDNIADALQPLMCANWAAGVDRQFRELGMGSSFIRFSVMSRSPEFPCVVQDCPFQVGKALHISPLVWPA